MAQSQRRASGLAFPLVQKINDAEERKCIQQELDTRTSRRNYQPTERGTNCAGHVKSGRIQRNPGGKVVVRVREGRDVKTGQACVRLTIADSGIGMAKETRQHMFDPFFTTKSVTGTGLGLWVSAEIITNHRAITRVRSSQDAEHHGTVISISFPQD